MDTTYFNQFGLMVFRSAHLKKNLLWYEVEYETNDLYRKGIQELLDDGWEIEGIIADGRPGLRNLFPHIPFQMCHFHQFQIVTRHISKKPKLPAGKELWELMFLLTQTDRESFEHWLTKWHEKWKEFLNEKTYNKNLLSKRKWWYTHKNIRSAYSSLNRNLPYLFTFEKYYPQIIIPNTTNSLDGYFGHLKDKLNLHRGASQETQIKLISTLIFS